jgi:hypothetical protein
MQIYTQFLECKILQTPYNTVYKTSCFLRTNGGQTGRGDLIGSLQELEHGLKRSRDLSLCVYKVKYVTF